MILCLFCFQSEISVNDDFFDVQFHHPFSIVTITLFIIIKKIDHRHKDDFTDNWPLSDVRLERTWGLHLQKIGPHLHLHKIAAPHLGATG